MGPTPPPEAVTGRELILHLTENKPSLLERLCRVGSDELLHSQVDWSLAARRVSIKRCRNPVCGRSTQAEVPTNYPIDHVFSVIFSPKRLLCVIIWVVNIRYEG